MAKLSPKALMQSGLNAQSASEDEFEKIRREHRERDAASPEGKQKESEKKLEETAKKVREGKIPAPSSDDMGPVNPGNEMLKGAMAAEEAAKQRAAMQKALLKGATEGMGGKELEKAMNKKKGGIIKKMAGGGKVSQLAKANGCAVRGKTRGKIC